MSKPSHSNDETMEAIDRQPVPDESGYMKPCLECKEVYEAHGMPHGLCEDCQADFNALDAEYQLEKAMHYGDMRAETKPMKESSRES